MADRSTSQIASRKEPRQARSVDLVAAILDAATRVLAKDGARRFTTARVAERAGVSVGSLYQYFPNKAAILFRLQSDEWRRTADLLGRILEDGQRPPLDRLRRLVHAFVRSECEEADMRVALADAAPFYRDAPEAGEARARGRAIFRRFVAEALPGAPAMQRDRVGDLIRLTLSEVGKRFSERPRSDEEIAEHAEALADMLCAYLQSLQTDAVHAAARGARALTGPNDRR